jgi:tRNA U34 5-methylaminomethyl-2-thiouridine-forming methyltransferase MnmC
MERDPQFEIVIVNSGVCSLRSREFGEVFHPVIGPMAEARTLHIQQQRLIERAAETAAPFVVWDVGFGAAANAIAVLETLSHARQGTRIALHSFDRTTLALEFALKHLRELAYLAPYAPLLEALLRTPDGISLGHPAQDAKVQVVSTGAALIRWQLHLGDFRNSLNLPGLASPNAILYDPYSPKANPELWTLEHFQRLYERLRVDVPCLLTSYTRSTAVRTAFLLGGFFVGAGVAVAEKTETTVATNCLGLLASPLDQRWLARVQRSPQAAPLRECGAPGPITSEDFAALQNHPQFRP